MPKMVNNGTWWMFTQADSYRASRRSLFESTKGITGASLTKLHAFGVERNAETTNFQPDTPLIEISSSEKRAYLSPKTEGLRKVYYREFWHSLLWAVTLHQPMKSLRPLPISQSLFRCRSRWGQRERQRSLDAPCLFFVAFSVGPIGTRVTPLVSSVGVQRV
jgi:hypothetical protein